MPPALLAVVKMQCLEGLLHRLMASSGEPIAHPPWRYLDLTQHAVWLADALKRTFHEHMRQEAHYLQQHAQT